MSDAFGQRACCLGYPRAWADSAARYARRAIELDPELAEGHKALGLALAGQGRISDAVEAYLRALELNPNHVGAANNVGVEFRRLGRFDEALPWLRHATRLTPNHPHPRVNLALTYTHLAMDVEAREWLEGGLVLDPRHSLGRTLRAYHSMVQGEVDGALERVEQIVEERPEDAGSWLGAAVVAYLARDFGRAVPWCRESLRMAPDNALRNFWHLNQTLLGLSPVALGDRAAGPEVLREAMRDHDRVIEGGYASYLRRWDLATAHAALGETDQALHWLEQAYGAGFRLFRLVKMDPAFDELRDDPRLQRLTEQTEADVAEMRERVIGEEWATGIR